MAIGPDDMSDDRPDDATADMLPEHHAGTDPNATPAERDDDSRSDLEQAVASRSDAVERGEGGTEPDPMTAPGDYVGTGGTGGVVRNQDQDAQ